MAREAGADTLMYWDIEKLKRFEALVRADERDRAMRENAYVQAEREACAKVCDDFGPTLANGAMLAEAIRERGNA
jgi:hypothetical protein